MILATTTSTRDSGLLEALIPEFERQTGVKVKIIAVGTGAALRMAGKGDADAVLVHAPAAEKVYVDKGDLTEGRLVMHNDFVLVGPKDDPAAARSKSHLAEALRAIAETGTFVSRGDDSGTHKKELALWRAADVEPAAGPRRIESGQGMGATLNIADQRGGYTLTDRGTYLAFKSRIALEVVFAGDDSLLNCYHIHLVSPAKHPHAKARQARALSAFFAAPKTQKLIGVFGRAKFGEPLFVADAAAPPDAGSGDAGSRRSSARCEP